jgi:hypothetical protein
VQLKFQSDYMKPTFFTQGKTTRQTVTQLGKIILELDKSTNQNMFCSEFAYHMLALSACSPDQIRAAGPNGADCVQTPFEPMNLASASSSEVGLADGPLIALTALPEKPGLVSSVFCSNGEKQQEKPHLSFFHSKYEKTKRTHLPERRSSLQRPSRCCHGRRSFDGWSRAIVPRSHCRSHC